MKQSESQKRSKTRVSHVASGDMTLKEFKRGLSSDEIRPVKRGLWGEFIYKVGMTLSRLLLRVEVRGLENLPAHDSYILCPNHETYIDGMWVGGYLPRTHLKRYACLAAQDLLTDHGAFGRLIMRVGRGIPLDRKGKPLNGLKMAIKQINDGNILMVHPEGTRTRSGKLGRIQEGAAFISRQSNAPIIPVFIDGGFEIFSPHMKLPSWWNKKERRRRRLILTYGEPLYPKQYKNAKALTEALEAWLTERFENKEIEREY